MTETIRGATHGLQIGEEDGSHLILLSSNDPTALDKFIDEFHQRNGRAVEVLHRRPNELLFRGHATERCVTKLLRENGTRIVWPARYYEGWEEFTVLATSERQLRDAIANVKRPNVVEPGQVEVVTGERLPIGVTAADMMDGITDRQLEVLRAAIDLGYYEAPRRIATEELARRLDITPSTLKEHLRKAEEALVNGFESLVSRYGPMLVSATKRRGRPSSK